MDKLPSEMLAMILGLVPDKSLLECERVCHRWRDTIINEKLYAKKCERILYLKPELIPTFAHHRFEQNIKCDANATKTFYHKLQRLCPWNLDENSKHPNILTYNCKNGEVPADWIERHNYSGVYDMVWLPESNYLICSCYDTIQVWDMVNYERLNVFEGRLLDSPDEKATCFYGCGPALVTGTSRGKLQAYDLLTSKRIGQTDMQGYEMLSDVKGYRNSLLAVDWRGLLIQWLWKISESGEMTFILQRKFKPPLPAEDQEDMFRKYNSRFVERLVDFNDLIGVTNCSDAFCIFDIKTCQIATWIRNPDKTGELYNILCLQVYQNSAYWAGSKGILYHMKLELDQKTVRTVKREDVVETFQTRFEDSITSIAIREDRILIGDVNAEIHCLDRIPEKPLGQDSFRFLLESGHSYKSFIWAVDMDESRIFSGDSESCLVIHDFWPQDTNSNTTPPCKKVRQN